MSAAALSGFRRLVRASKKAFRGDAYALKNASITLKAEFGKYKTVTNKEELAELFKGVDEVEEMLMFNIVQGRRNDRGNYEVQLSPEHSTTLSAGQSLPNGPEMAPVDPSYSGQDVVVEKTKASGCKSSKIVDVEVK